MTLGPELHEQITLILRNPEKSTQTAKALLTTYTQACEEAAADFLKKKTQLHMRNKRKRTHHASASTDAISRKLTTSLLKTPHLQTNQKAELLKNIRNIKRATHKAAVAKTQAQIQEELDNIFKDPEHNTTQNLWKYVKQSDIALYKAKQTGRNKVIRYDDSLETN
jgi:GGDEF domain-containing protein